MDYSIFKIIFSQLSNPNRVVENIIDYVATQGEYIATQNDIQKHVDYATPKIVITLERANLLVGSNEKGVFSEKVKMGRSVKKYYAVNKQAWDAIQNFVSAYPK